MLGIGIYVFFLGCIWLFFVIKKTNTLDFKNISSNIINVSNITFFLLALFSIVGMGILIHMNTQNKNIEINEDGTIHSTYY